MSNKIERYNHYGVMVNVRSDLKGKHKDYCLCYRNCQKFKPSGNENCKIAQTVFETCVKFGIVTPMWECPEYVENINTE